MPLERELSYDFPNLSPVGSGLPSGSSSSNSPPHSVRPHVTRQIHNVGHEEKKVCVPLIISCIEKRYHVEISLWLFWYFVISAQVQTWSRRSDDVASSTSRCSFTAYVGFSMMEKEGDVRGHDGVVSWVLTQSPSTPTLMISSMPPWIIKSIVGSTLSTPDRVSSTLGRRTTTTSLPLRSSMLLWRIRPRIGFVRTLFYTVESVCCDVLHCFSCFRSFPSIPVLSIRWTYSCLLNKVPLPLLFFWYVGLALSSFFSPLNVIY